MLIREDPSSVSEAGFAILLMAYLMVRYAINENGGHKARFSRI